MTTAERARPRRRRARTWLAVLAALLALAVAAVAGVGWYYSGQLLDVSHAPDPYDLTIAAAGGGTVTLSRTADSARSGTFGLAWAGGSAVVGDVLRSDGATVTRLLRGSAPPSGARARLVTAVWDGDPRTARGLPFTEVEVSDPLGPMPAWYVVGSKPTWVVAVHGRGGTRQEGLRILPTLHRLGMPVLDLSYRNDAGAPRSPDGLYHLGDSEWRDVEAGVRYAADHGATSVVLYGWSMGGAIVEAFLQRSSYAAKVRAVVLDAPVLDWRATLNLQAANRGLPQFLTAVAEQVVSWRIGIHWDDFDLVRHAQRVQVPTLLFHGDEDDTVPVGPARAVARARPVPGADHTQAWNVDPPAYEAAVSRFLVRMIGTVPVDAPTGDATRSPAAMTVPT